MLLRRGLVLLVAVVPLLLGTSSGAGAAPAERSVRTTQVATYNLFLGGDIGTLAAGAGSPQQLVAAATALWAEVVASDPPQRMAAVADLLAGDGPDVVGLQEVARWETAPLPAGTLAPRYDFLALLLDALAARGAPYRVLVSNTNLVSPAIPLPGLGIAVRYVDRDVVLARADLATSQLKAGSTTSQSFTAAVPVALPPPLPAVVITRGWSSVDVTLRGKAYRVVNTHLEAFSAVVRVLQARELAAALAGSPHPVVLVGDLNDDPGTGAVAVLSSALGLTDAWTAGTGPGLTAGQDDLGGPADLDRRIDYVLHEADRRPCLDAVEAHVVGEEPADRTAGGLWPSDHAGVVATLEVAVHC